MPSHHLKSYRNEEWINKKPVLLTSWNTLRKRPPAVSGMWQRARLKAIIASIEGRHAS